MTNDRISSLLTDVWNSTWEGWCGHRYGERPRALFDERRVPRNSARSRTKHAKSLNWSFESEMVLTSTGGGFEKTNSISCGFEARGNHYGTLAAR